MWLYLDKYFLFVQKIQKKPANGAQWQVAKKLLPCIREAFDQSAEQEIGGKPKIDDGLRHINRNGIKPDDTKEKRHKEKIEQKLH